MPSVMSTWERMQLTHMFDGFGMIEVPHKQHNLQEDEVDLSADVGIPVPTRVTVQLTGGPWTYTWP